MIIRILTARVPQRHAAAFEAVLREQLPLMRQHDGLLYVKLARQAHREYDDVLLFEEWRDAASLYGWTGPNVDRPRLLPGAEGLADSVDVTHYEALDLDPDAIFATGTPAWGAGGDAEGETPSAREAASSG
jgi:hypothetical protein